jgi:hypothetical protein
MTLQSIEFDQPTDERLLRQALGCFASAFALPHRAWTASSNLASPRPE